MFPGTAIATHCELLNIVHQQLLSITNDYNVRVTLTAPTGSPSFYNLPSIQTPIGGSYETSLIVVQHYTLIADSGCNKDNLSTRQCQLVCRREHIRNLCAHCRPVSLERQIMGVNVTSDNLSECTVQDYSRYGECQCLNV